LVVNDAVSGGSGQAVVGGDGGKDAVGVDAEQAAKQEKRRAKLQAFKDKIAKEGGPVA
jgi:hypothetical protein